MEIASLWSWEQDSHWNICSQIVPLCFLFADMPNTLPTGMEDKRQVTDCMQWSMAPEVLTQAGMVSLLMMECDVH